MPTSRFDRTGKAWPWVLPAARCSSQGRRAPGEALSEAKVHRVLACWSIGTTVGDVTMLRLRQHGLEWRQVDDEVVALDLDTARYLATNRTGALLWDQLAVGATRETLIARLMEGWDLDEARAAADVDAFLAMLTDRGLLESA